MSEGRRGRLWNLPEHRSCHRARTHGVRQSLLLLRHPPCSIHTCFCEDLRVG